MDVTIDLSTEPSEAGSGPTENTGETGVGPSSSGESKHLLKAENSEDSKKERRDANTEQNLQREACHQDATSVPASAKPDDLNPQVVEESMEEHTNHHSKHELPAKKRKKRHKHGDGKLPDGKEMKRQRRAYAAESKHRSKADSAEERRKERSDSNTEQDFQREACPQDATSVPASPSPDEVNPQVVEENMEEHTNQNSKHDLATKKRKKRHKSGDGKLLDEKEMKRQRRAYAAEKKLHKLSRGKISKNDIVRRVSKERPWSYYFIITGFLLATSVIASMVLCSHWHQYLLILTSGLVILMGVLGILHKGDYLNKQKNYAYISVAAVGYISALTGCALQCKFLTPRMWMMAHALRNESVGFTLQNLVSSDLYEWRTHTRDVWLCLGLEFASLLLVIFCFVTCAAAVLVFHHFWDANYKYTGKFRPYRLPPCMNPMGQLFISQAVLFMGFVMSNLPMCPFEATVLAPVWTGGLVVIGGISSICAHKRPDSKTLVGSSFLINAAAALCCIAAIGLSVSGLSKCVKVTTKQPGAELVLQEVGLSTVTAKIVGVERLLETSLVAFAMSIFVLLVATVFVFGQMAHMFRILVPNEPDDSVLKLDPDGKSSVIIMFRSTLSRVRRKRRAQNKIPAQNTQSNENVTHEPV